MGELAWRGYNIALPEIDVGDDIFTVNDNTGAMLRIQVKTARAVSMKRRVGAKYQFNLRRSAIMTSQSPELHFVFACRVERGFRFLVMSRDVLRNYVLANNVGSPGERKNGGRRFDIYIENDGRAKCSGMDWTNHFEDWHAWPKIDRGRDGGLHHESV
jgi:hypothetical protein